MSDNDTKTDSIGKWTRISKDGAAVEAWSCDLNERHRKALTIDTKMWGKVTYAARPHWFWRVFSLFGIWKWAADKMPHNASNAKGTQ